jgi:hypothetical protein
MAVRMVKRDSLTSEHLKKQFGSSFELVNYAIAQAKDMIKSDRPCRISTQIHNRAYQILLEIGENKDHYQDFSFKNSKEEEEE